MTINGTIHAPQAIILTITILSIGISLQKSSSGVTKKNDFITDVLAQAFLLGLLYWGGFFGN